ncbi:hypothetical protein [Streptomyces marokkonensis]|uniref:hypothetical protein n=1 Tax=Streptomyces marokkonensis TaxID=324855 RepID=UPI001FCC1644|nr:hypothetical protein [Streptomyces marokkonensis]
MSSTTGATGTTGTNCPYCGWPDDAEPFRVVSRHATATGSTVWTRCGCGSLQVRAVDEHGVRMMSRSRPAAPPTRRGAGPAGERTGRPLTDPPPRLY